MTDSRFQTMRHIEVVRNYLNLCIRELLDRAEQHDQSKLQSPELEAADEWIERLRSYQYNSPEYVSILAQVKPILDHHYARNPHHPEHFKNGIQDMTLIDLIEMLMDWKAASMRRSDGNVLKSIEINQERFHYSDELRRVLENTAKWLNSQDVYHKVEES